MDTADIPLPPRIRVIGAWAERSFRAAMSCFLRAELWVGLAWTSRFARLFK
jgi:hypothetical protein